MRLFMILVLALALGCDAAPPAAPAAKPATPSGGPLAQATPTPPANASAGVPEATPPGAPAAGATTDEPGTVPVPEGFRPPTLAAAVEGGTPTGAEKQTLDVGGWTLEHAHNRGVATNTSTGATVALWEARTGCTDYRFEAGIASVVGTLVSFRFEERGTCPGAPTKGSGFSAIDLATGKPVQLTDRFGAAEVDAALAADSWLSNARSKPGIFKCLYDENALKADHFAIQSISGDRVVVRLGLGHGCESHKGISTQLDLTLTAPPAMQAEIVAAGARHTLGEHLILTLAAAPAKE